MTRSTASFGPSNQGLLRRDALMLAVYQRLRFRVLLPRSVFRCCEPRTRYGDPELGQERTRKDGTSPLALRSEGGGTVAPTQLSGGESAALLDQLAELLADAIWADLSGDI